MRVSRGDVMSRCLSFREHYFDSLYRLSGFQPVAIDSAFLRSRGLSADISPAIDKLLRDASDKFLQLFNNRSLTASPAIRIGRLNPQGPLEKHNYTGMCPAYVYEVNPSHGSCLFSCQYCLVTDGDHRREITVWQNYAERIEQFLAENWKSPCFYYFSPKTDAFSEPLLETGITHDILQTFVRHFRLNPSSRARLFIASKAGPSHLTYLHEGRTPLDLLAEMPGKVQFNSSIGILPDSLRDVLEPGPPRVEERLRALSLCRSAGTFAEALLLQPILLPFLDADLIPQYAAHFMQAGVKHVKPEFLTVDLSNLVVIAQFVNHFYPEQLAPLFADYLTEGNEDHLKQRQRLAPDRIHSARGLEMMSVELGRAGIGMSVCNWVQRQLAPYSETVASLAEKSDREGYQCLGYQTRLFGGVEVPPPGPALDR